MSRSFVIILLLYFFSGSAYGQQTLDRLESQLKGADNDSVRFVTLVLLSNEVEYSDYSQCRLYADEAFAIASQLQADWAYGKIYLRLAFLETMEGDYAEALSYDLQSMEIYKKNKDSVNLAKAFIDVGSDYRDMGDYDEAYFYLTQSFLIAGNHRNVPDRQDSLIMAIALHNIGTVFTQLGQFDLALQHLRLSEKISYAVDDTDGPAYTADEVGELFLKKKDYVQAEKNLLAAEALAHKLKIRVLLPRTQYHLANLYLDKGEFVKSTTYFDSVIGQQAIVHNRFGIAECELGKGKVLARSGNYSAAMKLFESSMAASIKLNAKNLTLSCYSEMATLFELMKNYQQALNFLRQHEALRDSIFSKSTMEKLLKDQIRFETVYKDLEIVALSEVRQEQQSAIKRQELVQNILVVVAVLSITLLYTVYRSSRRRKRINMLLLEHQNEIKKRSVELHQLNQVKDKFFSVISHDLRSPMNALAGVLNLLDKQNISPQEFSELTQTIRVQFNHTRTLINNLLDWTILQMDKFSIHQEQINLHAAVEESFDSMRNLYPKKNIRMENQVDANAVGYADPNILNLVLRNLILNAIKFTESGGKIEVKAYPQGSALVVSVSDNGIGIKPESKQFLFEKTSGYSTRGTANEKGTGLGLILCKEFVEKNGGKIWMQSELGKGSTFFFTVPREHNSSGSAVGR